MLLPIDGCDVFVLPLVSVFILFLILIDKRIWVNSEEISLVCGATDMTLTLFNLIDEVILY